MDNLTYDIVRIIIAVAMALITAYLVPFLNSLAKNEKYARLVDFVETAVTAAEQTIKGDGRGGERKQEVVKAVREWLNGKGIKITDEQLDKLIESVVYQMNTYSLG